MRANIFPLITPFVGDRLKSRRRLRKQRHETDTPRGNFIEQEAAENHASETT
jgi:hypothetical protein